MSVPIYSLLDDELPVCFTEVKTYSVGCCIPLMICLSTEVREESTATLFLHDNLYSVWQQSSDGKEQNWKKNNPVKPRGLN